MSLLLLGHSAGDIGGWCVMSLKILRIFMVGLCFAGLAACAGSGVNMVAVVDKPLPADARTVDILVATTRGTNLPEGPEFTNSRSASLNFAAYTVSIPPGHESGKIEVGDDFLNPANGFTVLRERRLSRSDFERALGAGGEIGLFVHGYNTGFRDALFRAAQMKVDSGFPGKLVLFAWPSQGQLAGYLADRDATNYSRHYLADVMTMLGKGRQARQVNVLAHSMGTWLTVETIRDMRLTGRWTSLNKPRVILAAPDIDIDVFRSQMAVIGPLDPPMTVLTSPDDRALKASSRLTGGRDRLGAMKVDDPRILEIAKSAQLRVVDISSLDSDGPTNHNRFVTLAKYQPRLREIDQAGGQFRHAGAFVFRTLGNVVGAPFQIVETAITE